VTSPIRSGTTFSMSLQNVTDEINRPQVVDEVQPLLTLVSDFPNIQNSITDLDAPVDPVLQKEMDSVKDFGAKIFVHDDSEVQITKEQHIQPVQEVHSNKNIQHDL